MKRILVILMLLVCHDALAGGWIYRRRPEAGAPVATYYGFSLNRTNSSLVTSAAVDLAITNAWTICMLVDLSDSGDYHNLFQFGGGFGGGAPSVAKLAVLAGQAGSYIYWSNDAGTVFRYSIYPTIGIGLMDIGMTWDGASAVLYTNGAVCVPSSTPVSGAGSMANDARKLFLGSGSNNNGASLVDRMQGTIYLVDIYNYARAPTAMLASASAHCVSPVGSPNHSYNSYVSDPLTDTIGSVNLAAANIVQVSTVLTNCP